MTEDRKKEQQSWEAGGIYVEDYPGLHKSGYPAWRYHKWHPPEMVQDTAEDEEIQKQGYHVLDAPVTGVPRLYNWNHDLEDMSPRQLCKFAQDEYGVELPLDASHETLIKSIWEISRAAPQNKDRIVLLAQSIRMNYDEELATIRKMAEDMDMKESRTFYA